MRNPNRALHKLTRPSATWRSFTACLVRCCLIPARTAVRIHESLMKRMGGDVTVGKWEIHPGRAVVKVRLHQRHSAAGSCLEAAGGGGRQCIHAREATCRLRSIAGGCSRLRFTLLPGTFIHETSPANITSSSLRFVSGMYAPIGCGKAKSERPERRKRQSCISVLLSSLSGDALGAPPFWYNL